MNLIEQLLQRARTYNDGLTDGTYISEIIQEYEAEICDMNSQDQLFEKGQDRLGVDIMSYAPYRPLTIEIKTIKHQPTNRVTLRDTGDFHASFRLIVERDKFTITADDFKTDGLIRKYGRQILGLTDENASELAHEYIYTDLLKKARDVILGGK